MAGEKDSGCPRGCLTTGTEADTERAVTFEDINQAAIALHEALDPPPKPRGMTPCIIHIDELGFYPRSGLDRSARRTVDFSKDLHKPLSDDALLIPHPSMGIGNVDFDC